MYHGLNYSSFSVISLMVLVYYNYCTFLCNTVLLLWRLRLHSNQYCHHLNFPKVSRWQQNVLWSQSTLLINTSYQQWFAKWWLMANKDLSCLLQFQLLEVLFKSEMSFSIFYNIYFSQLSYYYYIFVTNRSDEIIKQKIGWDKQKMSMVLSIDL